MWTTELPPLPPMFWVRPHRRALDLAWPRFAPELLDDLDRLGDARRADRMPLGLQSAARVDREFAARARSGRLRRPAALPLFDQAERLHDHDLGDGEAVVDLEDVHVLEAVLPGHGHRLSWRLGRPTRSR